MRIWVIFGNWAKDNAGNFVKPFIDANEKYLVPGLADMHGHIPLDGTDEDVQDALWLCRKWCDHVEEQAW